MAGIHCPHCNGVTEVTGPVATPLGFTCRHCRSLATIEFFPAAGRAWQPGHSGVASTGDEATCFFHAEKRAEAACDQCGRFVCALCEIRVGERHLCPACFGGDGRGTGPQPHTERYRLVHTQLALWVAVGSFVLGPLALIGGPVAIYLAIRGLRHPRSLTGRRGIGAAISAIVFAAFEMLVWGGFTVAFFYGLWSLR